MTEFETEKFVLSFKDIRQFYKTGKWKTFRKKEMKRKKYRCELCWNGGIEHKEVRRYRRAIVLHHIKHLREFPALGLSPSNTMALCDECHRKMHPEEYKKAKITERWD